MQLDRQEFFWPMTLAITLLFTLNLYLRVSRREATFLQIDRARN